MRSATQRNVGGVAYHTAETPADSAIKKVPTANIIPTWAIGDLPQNSFQSLPIHVGGSLEASFVISIDAAMISTIASLWGVEYRFAGCLLRIVSAALDTSAKSTST